MEEKKTISRRVFEITLALYRVSDFFPREEPIRSSIREKANDILAESAQYPYERDIEMISMKIMGKIQSLIDLLKISKTLNFVRVINISIILREYESIFSFFEREISNLYRTEAVIKDRLTDEKNKADKQMSNKMSYKKNEKKILKDREIIHTAEKKERGEDISVNPMIHLKDIIEEKKEKMSFENPSDNAINNRQTEILGRIKDISEAKVSDFFEMFRGVSSKTIQRDLQDMVDKKILEKKGEKRWTTYIISS